VQVSWPWTKHAMCATDLAALQMWMPGQVVLVRVVLQACCRYVGSILLRSTTGISYAVPGAGFQ
jgi:hypothetical protein